jgi:exoribonuclease R
VTLALTNCCAPLSTQLCSLRSKEDHLAFSVIWEMDDDANIYDVRFCKSAIHSVASLTYDEAQVMLDTPAPKVHTLHVCICVCITGW